MSGSAQPATYAGWMPSDSRPRRRVTLAVTGAGLACCLLAAGCAAARPAGSPGTRAAAGTGTPAAPGHTGQPQAAGHLTKILVIMEENHSVGQVFPSQDRKSVVSGK